MTGIQAAAPSNVYDVSCVHEASIPWTRNAEGHLHATGFNSRRHPMRANHACVDLTYELEEPGAIAYEWKVRGCDDQGAEIFDCYWYLKDSDGMLRSGEGFLGEAEDFSLHLIDGLEAGTYTLTVGVFCMGDNGSITLNLAP